MQVYPKFSDQYLWGRSGGVDGTTSKIEIATFMDGHSARCTTTAPDIPPRPAKNTAWLDQISQPPTPQLLKAPCL